MVMLGHCPHSMKKTCPCNIDPLKPHFYKVYRVNLVFLFLLQNIDCGYSLELPCNEYPQKPHFYIAKLGFTGVNLVFLFLLQNKDCGYLLEPPQ